MRLANLFVLFFLWVNSSHAADTDPDSEEEFNNELVNFTGSESSINSMTELALAGNRQAFEFLYYFGKKDKDNFIINFLANDLNKYSRNLIKGIIGNNPNRFLRVNRQSIINHDDSDIICHNLKKIYPNNERLNTKLELLRKKKNF